MIYLFDNIIPYCVFYKSKTQWKFFSFSLIYNFCTSFSDKKEDTEIMPVHRYLINPRQYSERRSTQSSFVLKPLCFELLTNAISTIFPLRPQASH